MPTLKVNLTLLISFTHETSKLTGPKMESYENLAPADIKVLVSIASDHLPSGEKASLIYSSKFSNGE